MQTLAHMPLPFSHTFGLNMTFCHCIVASCAVVVMMLSYKPSAPGFDSQLGSECVMQYAGIGKEMHEAVFFCFKTLHYS